MRFLKMEKGRGRFCYPTGNWAKKMLKWLRSLPSLP
jgi:hypothetical protein